MKCLFLVLFLCIPHLSYALSESAYTQLLSSSPEFKKAEGELNTVWKIVRARVPDGMKKDLLEEQRYYVRKGRDIVADRCENATKAEKYTIASMSRTEELKTFLAYLEKGEVAVQGYIMSTHDAAGGGYGICKDVRLRGISYPTCFHLGYHYELEERGDLANKLKEAEEKNTRVTVIGELESSTYFKCSTIRLENSTDSSKESKVSKGKVYDYENIVWRFAEKHEPSEKSPSEFCYIVFQNDVMVVKSVTSYDPPSIDIYKILKKDESSFVAKQIESYTDEGNGYKKTETTSVTLSGNFLNNKLYINQWTPLSKTKLSVAETFNEQVARRYLQ